MVSGRNLNKYIYMYIKWIGTFICILILPKFWSVSPVKQIILKKVCLIPGMTISNVTLYILIDFCLYRTVK
jgi:hypothetical protein